MYAYVCVCVYIIYILHTCTYTELKCANVINNTNRIVYIQYICVYVLF